MPVADLFQSKKHIALWLLGLGAVAGTSFGVTVANTTNPDQSQNALMPQMALVTDMEPALQVMKYEVSIAEWNRCHDDGACQLRLRARPDQIAEETPATGLSYVDVNEYLTWINAATDGDYRLPTLDEWEHMAQPVLPDEPDPIFTDPSLRWASTYLIEEQASRALRPRGSYSTSPDGIVDLDGNVWEWTMNCFSGTANTNSANCPAFYVGGEHIAAMSFLVRDPARGGCAVGSPPAHLGLRLVAEQT